MSCSPNELKDYFLKALPDPQQRQMEGHLRTCVPCREELDRLRLTEAALFSLREEEIPQRIAFVSDKVFEPSALHRWWDGFWNSSAKLGFASAAMLSCALVTFSLTRPAPIMAPAVQPIVQTPVVATVKPPSDAEIQKRIDTAVERAVALRTSVMQSQLEQARARMLLSAAELDYTQRRDNVRIRQVSNLGPPNRGEEQQ